MTTLLQYNQDGVLIHSHSGYVQSSGQVVDIGCERELGERPESERQFAVILNDGAIDILSIRGAPDIQTTRGSTVAGAGRGIEFVDKDHVAVSFRTTGVIILALGTATLNSFDPDGNLSWYNIPPAKQLANHNGFGCTVDGKNFYFGLTNTSLLARAHRIIWLAQEGSTLKTKTLDSSPSWGSQSTDQIRGLAFNGRDMWVLLKDGSQYYLELHRNTGMAGSLANFVRHPTRYNITSDGPVNPKFGLTFDGRSLYTMTRT